MQMLKNPLNSRGNHRLSVDGDGLGVQLNLAVFAAKGVEPSLKIRTGKMGGESVFGVRLLNAGLGGTGKNGFAKVGIG